MKLIRQALLFWKQAVDMSPAAKEHKAYQEFVRDIALKSYVDIVEFIRCYPKYTLLSDRRFPGASLSRSEGSNRCL